jgi:AcrR family transcriptional regulator
MPNPPAQKRRPRASRAQPIRARPAARGDRRREVLEAGLVLIAERGYAGASLRTLAERVGMRQPSLYHWFDSKEQLALRIIEEFAGDMFVPHAPLPERLRDVPRWIRDDIFALYEKPTHAAFVRFAFSVSRVDPRFGALMRDIFVERAGAAMKLILATLHRGERLTVDEGVDFMRSIVSAIGFRVMEEKVLFDERGLGPEVRRYADFVVACAEEWLARREPRDA